MGRHALAHAPRDADALAIAVALRDGLHRIVRLRERSGSASVSASASARATALARKPMVAPTAIRTPSHNNGDALDGRDALRLGVAQRDARTDGDGDRDGKPLCERQPHAHALGDAWR